MFAKPANNIPKPILITWTDTDLDTMSEISASDLTNAELLWKRDAMAGFTNLLNAEDEPLRGSID